MKIETKAYACIEDLKALRFECRECGAILILPFVAASHRKLEKCPTCRNPWTVNPQNSYETEVSAFISATSNLLPCLKAMGFSLGIEVSMRENPLIDSNK